MFARYAMKEIKRRKLGGLANILGYDIAVAFLIVTVTLSQGYNLVAAGDLRGIGTHFAVYVPSSKICPCQFGEVGPFFKDVYTPTFNASIVETIRGLSGVEDAAPCLMFRLDNLTIAGIDFDSLATQTTTVSINEVVGSLPKVNNPNEVMLDSVFADVLKLDIGDTMTAFDRNLTVVGIANPSLHSKPAGIANIYAHLNTVQEIARYYGDLYNFGVRDINVVLVEISSKGDAEYINQVEQAVLQKLESYAGTNGAIVGYQCGFEARRVVSITEESAWMISIILLVSVTLFSIKSQFGSVVERTKEIGVLKAIGWMDSDIIKQIFFESILQGLAGGIIGAAIGCLILFIFPQFALITTQNLVLAVSPWLLLLGFAISLVGGVLAGMVPAWRAAKLQPAEALRRF